MNLDLRRIQVGDRVVISRPRSLHNLRETIDRLVVVTAVRATSFDAAGLCFRLNGKEWSGRHRVRLIVVEDTQPPVDCSPRADDKHSLKAS